MSPLPHRRTYALRARPTADRHPAHRGHQPEVDEVHPFTVDLQMDLSVDLFDSKDLQTGEPYVRPALTGQ